MCLFVSLEKTFPCRGSTVVKYASLKESPNLELNSCFCHLLGITNSNHTKLTSHHEMRVQDTTSITQELEIMICKAFSTVPHDSDSGLHSC